MTAPFESDRARLEAFLQQVLPAADTHPTRLHQAMRYACQGGKRLRALLVYATARTLGLPLTQVDACAAAVELIHAYSLVHDDLPAMDNDDLRRGRPTVHRAFDEATAILVGDALGTLAFEVLADDADIPDNRRGALILTLARASGSRGMVGGQALDLEAEQQAPKALALAALEDLHQRKTGALIAACLELPCLIASPSPDISHALSRCGESLGLAYQIQDDVLDVLGSSAQLGKTAGKDAASGKSTYVQLLGLAEAQTRAAVILGRARAALDHCPRAGPLRDAIHLVAGREQ